MNTYEVFIPDGDRAEAEDLGGALLAASTLAEEAAPGFGGFRLARARVIVLRDGHYDGLATSLARSGMRRGCSA